MKTFTVALALAQVVLAGCLDDAFNAKGPDCYPVIQLPGRGPNDIPSEEQYTDLTAPAEWTWRASADCGPTYWRLERGDGHIEWKTGLEVDFDPNAVAFYNLSLVLQEGEGFVVKHSVPLHVFERHQWDTRRVFTAGVDDVTLEVPVACCAQALVSEVVLDPSQARPPGDWLIVKDEAGVTIGAGEAVVRRGSGDDDHWTDDVTYGTWTFTVVRSDPMSPYFGKGFELVTVVSAAYLGIYEPGQQVSPPS